jgi:hypothetical protein
VLKTLDDAIAQFERRASNFRRVYEGTPTDLKAYREEYDELASDCLQVANWLRELKEVKGHENI